jgi:hypothetical protein
LFDGRQQLDDGHQPPVLGVADLQDPFRCRVGDERPGLDGRDRHRHVELGPSVPPAASATATSGWIGFSLDGLNVLRALDVERTPARP